MMRSLTVVFQPHHLLNLSAIPVSNPGLLHCPPPLILVSSEPFQRKSWNYVDLTTDNSNFPISGDRSLLRNPFIPLVDYVAYWSEQLTIPSSFPHPHILISFNFSLLLLPLCLHTLQFLICLHTISL